MKYTPQQQEANALAAIPRVLIQEMFSIKNGKERMCITEERTDGFITNILWGNGKGTLDAEEFKLLWWSQFSCVAWDQEG